MNKALKILIPLLIIAGGAGVAKYFLSQKPEAKRTKQARSTTVVEVMEAKAEDKTIVLHAMGTVVASREVVLFPEVGGRVVEQSERLIPGGHVKAGETLLQIDKRDYELTVKQQRASLAKARFDLRMEEQRKSIAEREWALMRGGAETQAGGQAGEKTNTSSEAGRALALREPHIEAARAALSAAQSGLDRARLNVERTTLKAPFNAFVKEEFVDLGQQLGPQSRVATLVGTDSFRIIASIPVDRLASIRLPGEASSAEAPSDGSRATIVLSLGPGRELRREGRVIQLMGDLDARGRMARLLIELKDPFRLNESGDQTPLLLGAYVRVELEGHELKDVVAIPREVLRKGDTLWLMGAKNELVFEPVEVAWRDETHAFVRGAFLPGSAGSNPSPDSKAGAPRIVLSNLPTPVAGMALRDINDAEDATAPDADAKVEGGAKVGPKAKTEAKDPRERQDASSQTGRTAR